MQYFDKFYHSIVRLILYDYWVAKTVFITLCFDNSSVRDGYGVLRLIIGGQYHRPLIMVPIELRVKLRMNVPKRVDTT